MTVEDQIKDEVFRVGARLTTMSLLRCKDEYNFWTGWIGALNWALRLYQQERDKGGAST